MIQHALKYAGLGFPVLPIVPNDKRPLTAHGVKDATTDVGQIARWRGAWPTFNIAIATAGLLVVDIDGADNEWPHDESRRQDLFATATARTPRGGHHHFFRADTARRNTSGKLAPGIDTRADGGYVLAYPSVVNGIQYTWVNELVARDKLSLPPAWLVDELDALAVTLAPPATVPPGDVPTVSNIGGDVAALAAAYLDALPPAISGSGGHNAAYTAAAALVHGFALSPDDAFALLWSQYNPRCRPPWSEKELRHKVESAENSPHERPRGYLRDARNETENLRQPDLSQFNPSTAPASAEFKPFPTDALPSPVREYVIESGKAIGCDPAAIALPMLSSLAGAIGNTRRIELKPGWCEPSVIWTALVCDSGQRKTPAIEAATNFLEREELPEVRRVVSDATREALVGILLVHPRGVLLVRDELTGFFSFAEYKATKGGDVAFFLSLHSAKALRVDRKAKNPETGKQDATFVPVASISVTGGIQPGALKRVITAEFFENGLAARFFMAWPPKHPRRWSDATVSASLIDAVQTIFSRLCALEFKGDLGGAIDIPLAPSARDAFKRFVDEHGAEMLNMSTNGAALWSKLEGGAARIALVLHLVRVAAGEASEDAVDKRSIEAGVKLARWFGAEGLRIYGLLGQLDEGDGDNVDYKLLDWVEGKGGIVRPREAQMGCGWLRAPGAAEAAFTELQKAGFGIWQVTPSGKRGGRPAREFVLAT